MITIGTADYAWINPFSYWNISTTFSLVPRSDNGQINSSPRAVSLPLRLQSGCHHTIPITVSDPDGDAVRCRWAVGNECKSVCNAIPGAVLNSATCTITYHANNGTGYKAVAVMVEDFIPGSSQPLSSVALQFLVLVNSTHRKCFQKPTFISPTPPSGTCISVPLGRAYRAQLRASNGRIRVRIADIQIASPTGTRKGELQRIHTSGRPYYFVNVYWLPLKSQQNMTHHFCFMAVSSEGVTSDQSCIKLAVGHSLPPYPLKNKYLARLADTTLPIKFNLTIHRTAVKAFIIFYEYSSDVEVYRIDASSSPEITFTELTQITVKPNYKFSEGNTYYIIFEKGVVWNYGCQGSEAIVDKNYWMFDVIGKFLYA